MITVNPDQTEEARWRRLLDGMLLGSKEIVNPHSFEELMGQEDAAAAWNWMRPRLPVRLAFPRSYSFAGRHLLGFNFENCQLIQADFCGCEMEETRLDGSDLRDAAFKGASLKRCSLRKAYASKINFAHATLEDCLWWKTSMPGGLFSGARLITTQPTRQRALERCDLTGAELTHSHWQGMTICDSELGGAILIETTFSEVLCTESSLRKAYLRKTKIEDSILREVDFSEARLNGGDEHTIKILGTEVSGCDLSDASLNGVESEDSVYSQCDWRRAQLGESWIHDSRFCRQRGVSGLVFHNVLAERSDLSGVLRDQDLILAAREGSVRLDCGADDPGAILVPGLEPLVF